MFKLNIKHIVSFLSLALFMFIAIGTGEDEDFDPNATIEEKLEGEWEADQGSFQEKYVFDKDGTGYTQAYYSGEWQEKENITWTHGSDKYSNKDEEYDYVEVDDGKLKLKFIINYSTLTDGKIMSLSRRAGSKVTGTYKKNK